MEGLRERLRRISAAWHQGVDDVFSTYPLSTPEGYGRFLQAHAQALFPLEEAFERAGIERLLPDWQTRRRRFALAADLEALGMPVPVPPALEIPTDDAWLWGAAYVMEGSRMGSRMLGKRMQEGDRAWSHGALGYLCHRLDEPLWPRFVKELDAQAGQLDEARVTEGVHYTFRLFNGAGSDNVASAAP